MGLSSIVSIIHMVTIATMLNFNDGNNGHGLKNVACEQGFKRYSETTHTLGFFGHISWSQVTNLFAFKISSFKPFFLHNYNSLDLVWNVKQGPCTEVFFTHLFPNLMKEDTVIYRR